MKIILSILSNIPPCPGIISPKSFIFVNLFILDAAKSPIWLKTLKSIVIPSIAKYDIFKSANLFISIVYTILNITAPTIPPILPYTDFLGLIGVNLCFPINEPTKYANVSVPHDAIAIYHIRNFPFSTLYINGTNIKKPNTYNTPKVDITTSTKFVFIFVIIAFVKNIIIIICVSNVIISIGIKSKNAIKAATIRPIILSPLSLFLKALKYSLIARIPTIETAIFTIVVFPKIKITSNALNKITPDTILFIIILLPPHLVFHQNVYSFFDMLLWLRLNPLLKILANIYLKNKIQHMYFAKAKIHLFLILCLF